MHRYCVLFMYLLPLLSLDGHTSLSIVHQPQQAKLLSRALINHKDLTQQMLTSVK